MSYLTGIAYQNLLFATALAMLMAGLGYCFLRPQTALWRFISRRAATIMWGSTILMAGLWWVLGVLRYHGFHTSLIDTGTFTNVLWNTVHGRIMGTAVSWGTHFNQHFSPSLILLAILYLPWQSPEWLFGLTALIVASGGPALFYIALKRSLPAGTALIVSALWLYSSLVRGPVLVDFHETLIAAPVILWAAYFAITGKIIPSLILTLAALGFKEDMPVYVFSLGIVLAWSFRKHLAGYLISALAIVYYLVVTYWLWGVITPMHLDFLAIRFPQFASQPGGAWASILSDPSVLIAPMLHWEHLWVLLMLFIPVFLLPFFRWGALGLIPSLWLLLSLESFNVLILGVHYHLPLFAVIVLAAISGYEYLLKHKPHLTELAKWAMLSLTICFVFAFPTSMIADRQLNPGFYQAHRYFSTVATLADETQPEKSVMADVYLGTVFSNRCNIRHFPGDMLADCIMISNRYMGNPEALLAIGGLNYLSLAYNPCFWFLSRDGTYDARQNYMDTMRWMEAEGCGFPAWGTVPDFRASGNMAMQIPAGAGYGDRVQTTPYVFLPPGKYIYGVRLRAASMGQNQPVVVLVAKELLPSGEIKGLACHAYRSEIVNNRSSYQNLALDFEVKEWGLTCLVINFGTRGSFWWDGVGIDGINMDFNQLFQWMFVRETTAGHICLYPGAHIKGDDPLFADAIAIDDEFCYRKICRWDLGTLEEGDYWIWYVDDISRDIELYTWAKMFAVSVNEEGIKLRREIGTLDIERSEWTNAPNLSKIRAHLVPGEWIEIDAMEGFPAKVLLAKLWIMRDMPMSLDFFCE